jgi:mercuric ion binding protein
MSTTLVKHTLKRTLLPLLFVLMLASAPSFAGSEPTYTLTADGLACPFCAYGIEKQLGKIDGVEAVTTDIKSGTVTVVMAQDTVLERQDAEDAVTAAGFTLRDFSKNDDQQ